MRFSASGEDGRSPDLRPDVTYTLQARPDLLRSYRLFLPLALMAAAIQSYARWPTSVFPDWLWQVFAVGAVAATAATAFWQRRRSGVELAVSPGGIWVRTRPLRPHTVFVPWVQLGQIEVQSVYWGRAQMFSGVKYRLRMDTPVAKAPTRRRFVPCWPSDQTALVKALQAHATCPVQTPGRAAREVTASDWPVPSQRYSSRRLKLALIVSGVIVLLYVSVAVGVHVMRPDDSSSVPEREVATTEPPPALTAADLYDSEVFEYSGSVGDKPLKGELHARETFDHDDCGEVDADSGLQECRDRVEAVYEDPEQRSRVSQQVLLFHDHDTPEQLADSLEDVFATDILEFSDDWEPDDAGFHDSLIDFNEFYLVVTLIVTDDSVDPDSEDAESLDDDAFMWHMQTFQDVGRLG